MGRCWFGRKGVVVTVVVPRAVGVEPEHGVELVGACVARVPSGMMTLAPLAPDRHLSPKVIHPFVPTDVTFAGPPHFRIFPDAS